MTTLTNLSVAALGTLLTTLGSLGVADASQFFGNPQPLGEGFVRSFVTLDDQGNPSEIGAIFTQGALSLPTDETTPDIAILLSLPPQAATTAYNHLELIYRTYGLPGVPAALGVPRITIDYFLLSPQERALICPNPDISGPVATCTGDELAQALKPPEPEFIPQGMQPTGFVQPGFGERYFDPEAALPIFTGQQPFTTLYDYAFFDGQMSLTSFGATKDFLETQSNVTKPIKIPISYPKSGYYATEYSINFDGTRQEYKMALSGLTYSSVPELSPTSGLLALGALGAVSKVKNKLQKKN